MDFIKEIDKTIYTNSMLDHEFYQMWNCGELSIDTLQYYAKEYYYFERMFPRCVAFAYALCDDLKGRAILFANLADELSSPRTHLDLWVQFASSLGVSEQDILEHTPNPQTQKLIDDYLQISKLSYAEAMALMYAYEMQIPEIAKTKIDTLKKHYNITSKEALEFFSVHLTADEWHSKECAYLMDKLTNEQKKKCIETAKNGSSLLWQFLDGMLAYAMQIPKHAKSIA